MLDRRADRGQVERLELGLGADADRALRVADRHVLEARSRPSVALGGAATARGPCRRGRSWLAEDRRADLAGGGLDRERAGRRSSRARRRYRIASRAPLPDSSASEPSGLKIRSRATKPGSSGGASSSTPSAPTPVWRSHSAPHPVGVSATGGPRARRSGSRCPGPATSRSGGHCRGDSMACPQGPAPRRPRPRARRPVTSTSVTPAQLAHPRQLALGVAAGAPLHRLDVAREQLLEAERLARGGRRPRAVRGADLLDRAGGDHRLHARVDPRVERLALHRQADEQRRVAGVGRPQAVRSPGRLELPQLGSSSARTTRCGRSGGSARPPTARAWASARAARPGPARRPPPPSGRAARRAGAGAGRGRPAPRAGRGRCRRRRSGAAPAASSPSISACASAGVRPRAERASTGRKETSRCSSRRCCAGVATPVRTSRPR